MSIQVKDNRTKLRLSTPRTPLSVILLWGSLLTALAFGYRSVLGQNISGDISGFLFAETLLLLGSWFSMRGSSMSLSYPADRCLLTEYRHGFMRQQSVSASVVKRARCDTRQQSQQNTNVARLELITSIGVLPLGDHFTGPVDDLMRIETRVNEFLQARAHYLSA